MRTFLLAAALTAAVVTGATAQTYYDPSPRDPPFGKGNPGNDTYHLPNQTDLSGPIDSWGVSGAIASDDTPRAKRIHRTPIARTW